MKIGLIDVDGHNFPNIPLMKLSAYHKREGDDVGWYDPLPGGDYDRVYMSKVFTFSPDYEWPIRATEIIRGGSGYAIRTENGRERYCKDEDPDLPPEIEHIYPDYSLYGITDTAYGFLTRGCPRGCRFCHVAAKEGQRSYKVADLSEFWDGQKKLTLCDPNILACPDRMDLLGQIVDSKAIVDFNQGLDIRLMTDEVWEVMKDMRVRDYHFAWDRYEDKELVVPKLRWFAERFPRRKKDISVFVLVNDGTTFEQDLERVMTIREIGFHPFVMVYQRETLKKGDPLLALQRWANKRMIFWQVPTFEEYLGCVRKEC